MRTHRIWIEIVMVGTAVAFMLALLLATFGAVAATAVPAQGAPQASSREQTEQTFEGMVTCSRCGARHSARFDRSAGDCTRICVHGGASFALVNGESLYLLDGDLMTLKRAAGERARITGSLQGNTIHVSSVARM